MTMYNEDDQLFAKTMGAVMKNIQHLCTRKASSTWGADAWKKVVVTIVSDGRKKINPAVLAHLGIMGVYQEGVAKNEVNGKQVTAHIYEFTTQLCVAKDGSVRGPNQGTVPVQIIFCLKEQNKKKLNSHRWFLNAFGPILNPNVVVLLDVGTRVSYHIALQGELKLTNNLSSQLETLSITYGKHLIPIVQLVDVVVRLSPRNQDSSC